MIPAWLNRFAGTAALAILIASSSTFAATPADVRALLDQASSFKPDSLFDRMSTLESISALPPEQVHAVVTNEQIAKVLRDLDRQTIHVAQATVLQTLAKITPPSSPHYTEVAKAAFSQLLFDRRTSYEKLAPQLAPALDKVIADPKLQANVLANFYEHTEIARKQMADHLGAVLNKAISADPKTLEDWRGLAAAVEISGRIPIEAPGLSDRLWKLATVDCPVKKCIELTNRPWREVTETVNGLAAESVRKKVATDETLRRKVEAMPNKYWTRTEPPPWEEGAMRANRAVSTDDILLQAFRSDAKYREEVWSSLKNADSKDHKRALGIISYVHEDFLTGAAKYLTDTDLSQMRKSMSRMENVDSLWAAWERHPAVQMNRLIDTGAIGEGDMKVLSGGTGKLDPKDLAAIHSSLQAAPPASAQLFPELSEDGFYLKDFEKLKPLAVRDAATFNMLLKWTETLSAPMLKVYQPQISGLLGDYLRRAIREVAAGTSSDLALIQRALELNQKMPFVTEKELSALTKIFLKTANDFDHQEVRELASSTAYRLKQAGGKIDSETVDLLLGNLKSSNRAKQLGTVTFFYDSNQAAHHKDVLRLISAEDLNTPERKKAFVDSAASLAGQKETAADAQRVLRGLSEVVDSPKGREAKLLASSVKKFGDLKLNCVDTFSKLRPRGSAE